MEHTLGMPVTLWNIVRLIYLNMWLNRPRIIILGAFVAACIPALKIFLICVDYNTGVLLTTLLVAVPFFVWFGVVPLIVYVVDYNRDRQLPLEQRRLQKVENRMMTHAIIGRVSRH